MAAGKPWADGPYPLIETPSKTQDIKSHAAIHAASEMTHVHNVIIRGVNSIYLQAPNVRNPSDIKDFLHFVTLWGNFVDRHHETEEESIFPDLETFTGEKGLMQHSVDQHQAFHSGLQKLKDYASSTAPEDYSSDKLKSIIDGFGPTLQEHLVEEIDALLALKKYDSDGLIKVWKVSEVKARAKTRSTGAAKEEVFPFALGLADTTYEGGIHSFPPVPFFIPYIVHYLFSYKHAGTWRFAPCDFWGKPRPLQFVE